MCYFFGVVVGIDFCRDFVFNSVLGQSADRRVTAFRGILV